MEKKTIEEIGKIYDIEIEKIIKNIKKTRAKKVLLQLPDGLKPYANVIVDEIKDKTKCECFIWLDSCFGGCDIPLEVEKLEVDLIIQLGHSKWNYKIKDIHVI